MKRWGMFICGGILSLLTTVAFADSEHRSVLLCESHGIKDETGLAQELEKHAVVETIDCATTTEKRSDAIYVARGLPSATDLLSNIILANEPKVIVGLYRIEYQGLLADYPFVSNVKTIQADPPPASQLLLANSLFPRTPTLLLLFSSKSIQIRDDYLKQAKAFDINIVPAQVKNESDALRHIAENLDVDAVLAIPDQSIYNRFTLPTLLRTGYDLNVPLLGFSPQFVRVGALATTYIDTETLADRVLDHANHSNVARLTTSETASDILPPLSLEQGGDDASIRVNVNRSVSNSLSIVIPEKAILERQINSRSVPNSD